MGSRGYATPEQEQPKEELNFTVVGSFENKDDFGSDPYGYYVELNGVIIASYGDDYHDKGHDKCQGFIDGYCEAKGISPVPKYKYEERDDYRY